MKLIKHLKLMFITGKSNMLLFWLSFGTGMVVGIYG